jgi:serine protease
VVYTDTSKESQIDSIESGFHASRLSATTYNRIGKRNRVLSVPPSEVGAAVAALARVVGANNVTQVAYRRRLSITANDNYYVGSPGSTPPLYQTALTHGQWDMHIINLDGAWSAFASAPVQGAPIAVVDTGVDVSHAELKGGRIIRTMCFVTYPSSAAQTVSQYVTDTDGHGTNVAGIADDFTNNAFGFSGVAYDAPLLAYRIFPTDPAIGCDNNNDPQCSASSLDEKSAIDDAVAHGAKVINLSLGFDPSPKTCSTADPEYIAVENAINAGVVVVAASGNGGKAYLDCPAADPGVIAVGASALNDTVPTAITEYVPSYSNYIATSNGRYLVAPGGDSSSTTDSDNLHWINNLYSTTAYDAAKRQSCNGGLDAFGETGDCNVEIEGTSQATPHVVGVVSLMLAKKPNLTPAQIASGLCASADHIGDPKEGCGRLNAAAAVNWAATQP